MARVLLLFGALAALVVVSAFSPVSRSISHFKTPTILTRQRNFAVQNAVRPSQSQPVGRLLVVNSDEDEEGEEEQEGTAVTGMLQADMSLIKEGIKSVSNLNGSDVRVGIIMARWNADVIAGLYKVS